ncbi:polysaccharide biosynthesis/export family protein [Lyngbya aestuarii BL J]|uniref:Polysaccharide biosynthesis/export family protein n=1 Tax=Lyngbya aestuarii BL J TaxID=1348334 RepID=U7QM28_9CYAN|nr:SLBB domain-containing protein [Lyngbya aestuarii]ERT08175.1 polysaccharide biosynthesis/export family protein [Lyngbya aestuarii BL J]
MRVSILTVLTLSILTSGNCGATPHPLTLTFTSVEQRIASLPDSAYSTNPVGQHWARSFIEPLVLRGIIPPLDGNSIQPDQFITQAQFSSILQNAFGVNPLQPDIDPNQNVSRLEALVTLVQVLNLQSRQITPESLNRYFIDAHNIPKSNLSQVAAATENRLIVNYPNIRVLNPNKSATLAEVSAFVYQALVSLGEAPTLIQTGNNPRNNPRQRTPSPPQNPRSSSSTIQAIEVAENTDYNLGGGDRIAVFVANFPEHNGEYAILTNGLINMPLLGQFKVAGMTILQLERNLEARFSQTMKSPEVTVTLVSARPLNIAIAGEVNRPGAYALQLQVNPTEFPTITQAIQLAGGITQSANLREIKVQRKMGYGREKIIAVNLWDLFQSGDLRQDLTLRDDDKIIIPTLTRVDLTEASQLANNNLYPTESLPAKIAIVGEVFQPGSYTLQTGSGGAVLTVTRAIQEAGGITSTANLRQVKVRRPLNNGQEQIIDVDLFALLQGGDLRQDVILKNGDTIIIPTLTDVDLAEAPQLVNNNLYSAESKPMKVAIVGEVVRPGPYNLTADSASGGFLTVTQAIQQAGGITSSANLRQIQVKRLNRNGTEETINVNLFALIQQGDLRQDVILKTGDTIMIPTADKLTPNEVNDLARSTLSPNTIKVNFVGEVLRPGILDVPPNTPLSQAILAAGGFNNRAYEGAVELIRLSPDGTLEKREISVNFAEGITEENNPTLRNNDIIVVRPTGLNKLSDDLGNILNATSPFGIIFQLIERLF